MRIAAEGLVGELVDLVVGYARRANRCVGRADRQDEQEQDTWKQLRHYRISS